MKYTYKTTYKTYKRDFDKAVGELPQDFFKSNIVKLDVRSGVHTTIKQSLEIAEFIINSFEIRAKQKVEFGLFSVNSFHSNEFEVILGA